jgi:hypothetical protein
LIHVVHLQCHAIDVCHARARFEPKYDTSGTFVLKHSAQPGMSSSIMVRLRRTAGVVFNIESYGGNLTQRDDSTIILKNYRCLNARLLALLQEQFPQLDISVQACDGSDAFVVVFVLRPTSSVLCGSSFAQLFMFACIFACAVAHKLIYATLFLV